MCQSVAEPLSAEYWHIGAMMIRLRSSRLPTRNGVKSGAHGILGTRRLSVQKYSVSSGKRAAWAKAGSGLAEVVNAS